LQMNTMTDFVRCVLREIRTCCILRTFWTTCRRIAICKRNGQIALVRIAPRAGGQFIIQSDGCFFRKAPCSRKSVVPVFGW